MKRTGAQYGIGLFGEKEACWLRRSSDPRDPFYKYWDLLVVPDGEYLCTIIHRPYTQHPGYYIRFTDPKYGSMTTEEFHKLKEAKQWALEHFKIHK